MDPASVPGFYFVFQIKRLEPSYYLSTIRRDW